MSPRITILFSVWVLLFQDASPVSANESKAGHFAQTVWPLLNARCLACHGKEDTKLKGGLDLRTLDAAMRGGDSGRPVLVKGSPESSPLILSVLRTHPDWEPMPPKENDRLSQEHIEALREWVRDGAVWPTETELARLREHRSDDSVAVQTSGGRDSSWENREYPTESLWAYRPLRRIQPPAQGVNPIDAFINAQLVSHSIEAGEQADERSLIRRATIDLIGMPPTPSDLTSFVGGDERFETRWRDLIRGLLDSPQYGEQMGRRWLDVVRYADTAGFSNDFEQPHAWRYRDYVIRSFNRDTPYDRFIREQIAGDELPDGGGEGILATGFLRVGPWEHLGMAVEAETRQQWLDDTVNIVGNAFLGLEMSCFKCHDHKFDPLPTRDYYSLQAVFAATQLADLKTPFIEEESRFGFDERAAATALSLKVKEVKKGRFAGFNLKTIERRVQRWAKAYEPVSMGVYNGPPRTFTSNFLNNYPPASEKRTGPLMPVNILAGGSLAAPLDEVQPAPLSAVAALTAWKPNAIPATMAGRRLALAEWIADGRNPFTARVIVNRVWAWHFGGQALVSSPNNFGVKGSRPTHPELLDWLARWFVDNAWSFKKLHTLIMTSEAYRRTIRIPGGVEAEKANKLLAAFPVRRMTAEEMRDAMLRASGELNLAAGGIPARPNMNWDAARAPVNVQSGIDLPYRPDRTPSARNRRSVYTHQMRSRRDPLLEVFNQPGSERSCELRDESIVVSQAFALTNGDFVNDRSIAMADRITRENVDPIERVDAIFQRILGRNATDDERRQCLAHVSVQTEHHVSNPPTRIDTTKLIAGVSAYDPSYAQDYQPDLQSADVGPGIRALADLCLILFNTSEFLYLP